MPVNTCNKDPLGGSPASSHRKPRLCHVFKETKFGDILLLSASRTMFLKLSFCTSTSLDAGSNGTSLSFLGQNQLGTCSHEEALLSDSSGLAPGKLPHFGNDCSRIKPLARRRHTASGWSRVMQALSPTLSFRSLRPQLG